jgi:hypothetical protein
MIATPWPWLAAQHEATGLTGGIQGIDTKRANGASIGAPMMHHPRRAGERGDGERRGYSAHAAPGAASLDVRHDGPPLLAKPNSPATMENGTLPGRCREIKSL